MATDRTQTFEQSIYGPDGRLTSAGMKAAISSGYGTLYRGSIITSHAGLPTEATLAKGDAQKTEVARSALLAQQESINAQLAALSAPHETDEVQRQLLAQQVSSHPDPNTLVNTGGPGEGDMAGADGDKSDPKSEAGKKAKEEADAAQKAAADAAKLASGK